MMRCSFLGLRADYLIPQQREALTALGSTTLGNIRSEAATTPGLGKCRRCNRKKHFHMFWVIHCHVDV